MIQCILRIVIGVSVAVTVALTLRAVGVGEFAQGLWAGTLGNIAQTIIGMYIEERECE